MKTSRGPERTALEAIADHLEVPPTTFQNLTPRELQLFIAMRRAEAYYPGWPVSLSAISARLGLTHGGVKLTHRSLRAKFEAASTTATLPMTMHDPRWRSVVELAIRECYPQVPGYKLAPRLGMTHPALSYHIARIQREGPTLDPGHTRDEVVMAMLASGVPRMAIAVALDVTVGAIVPAGVAGQIGVIGASSQSAATSSPE